MEQTSPQPFCASCPTDLTISLPFLQKCIHSLLSQQYMGSEHQFSSIPFEIKIYSGHPLLFKN